MEAHHPERVPVRAPAANIAQPGKNELLIPMKRKTGEELKQLFPTLWDGGEPATGKAR
jgi:hypothetical protein